MKPMWYQPSTSSSHTSDTCRLLDTYRIRYNPSRNEQHILCPFHDDHQPSMSINLTKGVWYCHTCGVGGGLAKLQQRLEEENPNVRQHTPIQHCGTPPNPESLGPLRNPPRKHTRPALSKRHQRRNSPLPPPWIHRQ
ncbi:putative DNA primase [Propionibacterium phage PHL064M02]|uniref:Putative DNA primase n=3 Tax=Pahexavirus PHL117M01 TaxID=1982290 RepID=A0A0E3DLG4_9CAUD|nr:putative DNA primase [Propionibacterium phage PHL064M01]AII28883.1 putative DNA primase [Propionibacterium phage PHL064M02]